MPINIRANAHISRMTAFFSINVELIAAMHVLADCKHHAFAKEWYDKMYMSLSEKGIRTLGHISGMQLQGLEFLEFVLAEHMYDNADRLLNRILEYDSSKFLNKITGERLGLEKIHFLEENESGLNEIIKEIPFMHQGGTEFLQYAFAKTEYFKQEVVDLLREIMALGFEDTFQEICEKHSEHIETLKTRFLSVEPTALVQEVIGKKWEINVYDEYILIPSYFISPHHLLVNDHKDLMVVFDVMQRTEPNKEKSERISGVLNVITDKKRLEILRHLISQPSYNKVLAAMLNLKTSTITHHIDLLKSINLVKEQKVKNVKYFRADVEQVDKMLADLRDYLFNK